MAAPAIKLIPPSARCPPRIPPGQKKGVCNWRVVREGQAADADRKYNPGPNNWEKYVFELRLLEN